MRDFERAKLNSLALDGYSLQGHRFARVTQDCKSKNKLKEKCSGALQHTCKFLAPYSHVGVCIYL